MSLAQIFLTILGVLTAPLCGVVLFFLLLYLLERVLKVIRVGRVKYLLVMVRNLRRNYLRTSLTFVAIFILVVIVIPIWSLLAFLNDVTAEKSRDFKAIVTERWQRPSRLPFAYAATLELGAASKPEDVRPIDSMTWQFYVGSVDPSHPWAPESMVIFLALDPTKLRTMMDELEDLDQALVEKMKNNRRACLFGKKRLAALNKRVGERITVTGLNYHGIDLDCEIVGVLPEGRYDKHRYDESAIMHRDYLNAALDAFAQKNSYRHPMADRSLNLVWLRMPDAKAFERVAAQIENSSAYKSPAVKIETASSSSAAWLDAYQDLLAALRYLLAPAVLATMVLVIANAISISVRERRKEMAILKVLGYRPRQILTLVLGEALLIGACAGLLSAGLLYLVMTIGLGGVPFRVAFFTSFPIPPQAVVWGLLIGAGTALLGSWLPSWSARGTSVSDVFARVA